MGAAAIPPPLQPSTPQSTVTARAPPPVPPSRNNNNTAAILSDPSQLQTLHNEISLLSEVLSTQLNLSMAKHDFQRCMDIQAKTEQVKSLLGQVKLGQDVTQQYHEVRVQVMKLVNQ